MNNSVSMWWNVFVQLVEFLFTGATFYLQSEQGQREFNEVLQAFEAAMGRDFNGDGVVGEQTPANVNRVRSQTEQNTERYTYVRPNSDQENVSVFHGR